MIENVGFLDQTENIVTDNDFQYTVGSFAMSDETPFYEVSDNFCLYNKFVCILNGVMWMNGGTYEPNTILLKLPVTPLKDFQYFADRESNTYEIMYENANIPSHVTIDIRKDRTLTIFAKTTFTQGERVSFNIVIPLDQNSNGGGLVNRLINLLHTFGKKVCLC